MEMIEVKDKATEREFNDMQVAIYKDHPNWIRPIDQEINDTFDPEKNRLYGEGGEAIRWVLRDGGKTIGRIAAFINPRTVDTDDYKVGGLAFFECIDNQNAANLLFDTGKAWLEQRGIQAMDGPINFGERDKFWGVLVDGFTEPNYGMFYHPPYYQSLFENYGFQVYFNQYTYGRTWDQANDFEPRFYERAQQTLNDPDYTYRYLEKSEYEDAPKYFLEVYTKAWGGHKGVKPLTMEQAEKIFKKLAPIADNQLLYFGFYKGEPISFFISIPEINQLFKYVNGKMDLVGKLKFVYHKWRGHCRKCLGLVFGVAPEHQGKGVESAMVVSFSYIAWGVGMPYDTIEMNWIGDFNPKMMKVAEQLGATVWKTHVTYRKIFDPNIPFKRYPILE